MTHVITDPTTANMKCEGWLNMKKALILLSSVLIIALLSGCSSPNDKLEEIMKNDSGIYETVEFQDYLKYDEAGQLDQDGYYIYDNEEAEPDENVLPEGSARVSFADNAYINVQYYLDKEHNTPVVSKSIILKPGDSLYAECSLNKEVPSSTYYFSGFRLTENVDGNWVLVRTSEPANDGLILQLSKDDIGKELSLAPIGQYSVRTIKLKDSYIDNDDVEHELSGTWTVNDKPVSGNETEINPILSYIVSYEFNGNDYFYVSSEPECFYNNNDDGIVIFNKRDATDETEDYSVLLHQYLSIKLRSNDTRHVNVNNGPKQEVKAGGLLEIPRLKYGENVVIVTDVEWKELENCKDLILQTSETLEKNGEIAFRYTLIVPQKGGEFEFNPDDYSYAHGTIRFKCFGEEVTSLQYLARGSKITYEQKSAEPGYWLADGEHVIPVTTPEETKRALENISFTEKIGVTVRLDQPDYGGRIEYYVEKERITDNIYRGDSGTEITMKFFPWEGWISRFNNGAKYTVTTDKNQTVLIENVEVSKVAFTESETHKPKLKIVLDKSVGPDMRFAFEAPGLDRKDYSYKSSFFSRENVVLENVPIGTERGITISMSNYAIQSGTAVKILIEMAGNDKSGNKAKTVETVSYRLVENLTEIQKPIEIYNYLENANSKIWFDSVTITISLVDVMRYEQRTVSNALITVRNCQTLEALRTGSIIEGEEYVIITESAGRGYYVDGSDVKDGVYQKKVKFKDCDDTINTIVKDHPIRKYCVISLNSDDKYGECVFKHNGKNVVRKINAKPGDTILLEYSIKDESHKIVSTNGIKPKEAGTKAICEIKIDETYDGKTLSRESFGILVEEAA